MVSADDVRAVARSLPRTEEALVRDRVKFRMGRLVIDAWRMVVPKRVAAAQAAEDGPPPAAGRERGCT